MRNLIFFCNPDQKEETKSPVHHDNGIPSNRCQHPFPAEPPSPRRRRRRSTSGNLEHDLSELGFEYRFQPCCEQHQVPDNVLAKRQDVCFDCSTRLFHIASDSMIVHENRKMFIPNGPVFDDVSWLCQEMAIQWIVQQYSLQSITIYKEDITSDLETPVIQALVSNDLFDPETSSLTKQTPSSVLLIMTGKGKSRAGVLGISELLTTGMEAASAAFYLQQASLNHNMSVILFDPNVWGEHHGMQIIERSLDFVCSTIIRSSSFYILAHSAAGGYLVRYLLKKGPTHNNTLLNRIHGLVFTDSTHNIQWAKKDDLTLVSFLQSTNCLYVRNNNMQAAFAFQNTKENQEAGAPVTLIDVWWKHRFGNIPTVWAGTGNHSIMCWVARHVIWNFFQDKLERNICNTKDKCDELED